LDLSGNEQSFPHPHKFEAFPLFSLLYCFFAPRFLQKTKKASEKKNKQELIRRHSPPRQKIARPTPIKRFCGDTAAKSLYEKREHL